MALANEVQTARLNAVLHKLLGMKEGSPSPQLSPEIMPVLPVEHDRPEWEFLGGGRLSAGFVATAGGGAGTRVIHRFANPSGSGVLAVVELITSTMAAAGVLQLMRSSQNFVQNAAGTVWSRDLRDASTPACRLQSDNAHALGAAVVIGYFEGNTDQAVTPMSSSSWRWPLILPPGTFFDWASGSDNIGTSSCVVWRERALEPSETR